MEQEDSETPVMEQERPWGKSALDQNHPRWTRKTFVGTVKLTAGAETSLLTDLQEKLPLAKVNFFSEGLADILILWFERGQGECD